MKMTFASEFMFAVKQGPRLFFAPLIGAIKGSREAWQQAEKENQARLEAFRKTQEKQPPAS